MVEMNHMDGEFHLEPVVAAPPGYPRVPVGEPARILEVTDDGTHVGDLVADVVNGQINYLPFEDSEVSEHINTLLRDYFSTNVPVEVAFDFIEEEIPQIENREFASTRTYGLVPDIYADSDEEVDYALLVDSKGIVQYLTRLSPSAELVWDDGAWANIEAPDTLDVVDIDKDTAEALKGDIESGTYSIDQLKDVDDD